MKSIMRKLIMLMLMVFLSPMLVSCDGWALNQEETDRLYDAFIYELQNREITTFYYGESQHLEEYYLRVNFTGEKYSASETSEEYERYYKDGQLYTKYLNDLLEGSTIKEEVDFAELDYMQRIDEMDQLLLNIFLDENIDDYLIDIRGAGAPWGNDLIFEFDDQALVNSGYISSGESLELRVYSDCEFAIFDISFKYHTNETNLLIYLIRTTNPESLSIVYPDDLDQYGEVDEVTTL